jgi:hypothetical protein
VQTLHHELPGAGELMANLHVGAAYDKGASKGAGAAAGESGSGRQLIMRRCSAWSQSYCVVTADAAARKILAREPHECLTGHQIIGAFTTRPEDALLSRLNDDRNPLYGDLKAVPDPLLRTACDYEAGKR